MRNIRFDNQSKQVKLFPGGWGVQEQQLSKSHVCFTFSEVGHYFHVTLLQHSASSNEARVQHKAGTWKQKSWKNGTDLLHGFFGPCLLVICSLDIVFSLRWSTAFIDRKTLNVQAALLLELLRNYGMSINFAPLQLDCFCYCCLQMVNFLFSFLALK